jgi:hypothetical protein
MAGPRAELQQRARAALRVLQGEPLDDVARELRVPLGEIAQAVDALADADDLEPVLESMASEFGYTGRRQFEVSFLQIPGKSYTADCVWFDGTADAANTVAIIEIDKGALPST